MLTSLINHNKTDKNTWNAHTGHTYGPVYEDLFNKIKDKSTNIMEIGIERGGSIQLWHDYFQNATIYGIDVMDEKDVSSEIKNNSRIKLYTSINAYDNDFIKRTFTSNHIKFDMILDDGPHSLESMIFFVKYYSELLTNDGILVVEDIQNIEWIKTLTENTPEELKKYIKVYDLRGNTGRWDDILFVINKNI
jgi:cephalosporin hydroxylase